MLLPAFGLLTLSRARARAARAAAILGAALTLSGAALSASAQGPLSVVRIRVAGHDFSAGSPALSDGHETWAPLEILRECAISGAVNARGDAFDVSAAPSGRRGELAIARPAGAPMVALSDVAALANAVVDRWDTPGKDGQPRRDMAANTVYLLARVTAVQWENGSLVVRTSFPVAYRTRCLKNVAPRRGYVDLLGATVAGGVACPAPSGGEVLALRVGQNTEEIARVVAQLADGVAIAETDAPSNSQVRIAAAVSGTPLQTAAAQTTARQTGASQAPAPSLVSPDDTAAIQSVTGSPRAAERSGSAGRARPSYGRATLPSRAGGARRQGEPIEVRAVVFTADGAGRAELQIATTGPSMPFVHAVPGTEKLAIDIPNARLNLSSSDSADVATQDSLVHGYHVEERDEDGPVTRITLDTTKAVGFSIDPEADSIRIDVTTTRAGGGTLAGKLIVIDPGHGGPRVGAEGHEGGLVYYEKNVTLAIGRRLRACLEACGARVVMTRDADIDVSLPERSRIANSMGADLFISIHNDSNAIPNSASGTSTYYHEHDAISRAFAVCVQQAVSAVTGLPSKGALSDGLMYESGFAVLRNSRMPAVLVEVAYINNTVDRHHLLDPDFQQRVADAICRGAQRYLQGGPQTARRSVSPAPDGAVTVPVRADDGDTTGSM